MRSPCRSARRYARARLVVAPLLCLFSVIIPVLGYAGSLPDERKASLDYLLHQDCGSCHGMTLQGGLGPALLAERFKDWDIDRIVSMIMVGNPARAMPPWGGLLSDDDARYLAEKIKNGEPN